MMSTERCGSGQAGNRGLNFWLQSFLLQSDSYDNDDDDSDDSNDYVITNIVFLEHEHKNLQIFWKIYKYLQILRSIEWE